MKTSNELFNTAVNEENVSDFLGKTDRKNSAKMAYDVKEIVKVVKQIRGKGLEKVVDLDKTSFRVNSNVAAYDKIKRRNVNLEFIDLDGNSKLVITNRGGDDKAFASKTNEKGESEILVSGKWCKDVKKYFASL